MASCSECGLNGGETEELHSPGCTRYSGEFDSLFNGTSEKTNPFVTGIYEAVNARSLLFMKTYTANLLKEKLGPVAPELLDLYIEEMLDDPMINAGILTSSMLTIQVLNEQGLLDEEQVIKLLINNESKDQGWPGE